MTNDEKRIMRNTTRSIELALNAAIDMAMSATDSYCGTPAAVLYERLYLSLRGMKAIPAFDDLKAAAIPDNIG
jgi:hypothetical protein